MRALLALSVLAACSKAGAPAQPAPTSVSGLVVPDATGLAAFRPTEFPFLNLLDGVDDLATLACWRALEEKLVATYAVYVGASSYAIVSGDLPREKVEACVEEQLGHLAMFQRRQRDGELTIVDTAMGTVYAAWRGDHVVLGTRDDVVRATSSTTTGPSWLHAPDVPATFASTAMIAISTDQVFGNLLGVPTQRWKLTMDAPTKGWPERTLLDKLEDNLERFGREQEQLAKEKQKQKEAALRGDPPSPKPAPTFAGRLELEYATAAEATRAGEVVTKAAFTIPVEENLSAALAKLPQQVSGSTLVLTFDQNSFEGVELEKLQAWIATLQAQQRPQLQPDRRAPTE